MISFGAETRVFVSTAPVDFRTGVHGLVALVAEGLKAILIAAIFLCSVRSDGIGCMCVTATQLALLVEGLSEWSQVVPKLVKRPMKTA
jgi:transposase